MESGLWPVTQTDPLPPPPVPFEGARVQRKRITRIDIETFATTAGCPGCNAIRSGKRAQTHSDLCRSGIEECFRITPEGSERWDRRSEVLNETLAKEVERNVRRREKIGRAAGELPVQQELKEMLVLLDSDPRKRRVMKAATAAASSSSSQMEGSRAVAEMPTQQNSMAGGSRMDVEEEERRIQEFERTEHKTKNNDESRMDDNGEEGEDLRSSTVPIIRRRTATKDKRMMVVTTRESLDDS